MIRPLAFAGLAALLLASPAGAQAMDPNMPGMAMPKPATKTKPPHAGHGTPQAPAPAVPAPAADPHAGHVMPTPPGAADPHAGHPAPLVPAGAEEAIPTAPPPPPPTDHAADRDYDPAAMTAARAQLRAEHGDVRFGKVIAKLAEYQARSGPDGYRWDGQASFGGDVDRFLLKSEGEGTRGGRVDAAEAQALYSHALGPYFDLHAGVRQDFRPHDRTYATVGAEGLLPYWIDVEGALFLSSRGELLGRAEATYDLRLTQRLILQPRVELNFAAQDTRATRTGSGLSNAELGLRLRYELRREIAPYIGLSWDRRVGRTARFARAAGEDPDAASVVMGVRTWF